MKKQLLPGLLAAALLGGLALSVSAQNLAIVNGHAVPKERAEALKVQLERAGRVITPEIEGKIRKKSSPAKSSCKRRKIAASTHRRTTNCSSTWRASRY